MPPKDKPPDCKPAETHWRVGEAHWNETARVVVIRRCLSMFRRVVIPGVSRLALPLASRNMFAAVACGTALSSMRFNSSAHAERALTVAKSVNKVKRSHQASNGPTRKKLEMEAWQELNTLTAEEIDNCEGQGIALILNSWSYFSKFWEHGQDGPLGASDPLHQQADKSATAGAQ
jgi:hypothetical protein